VGYFQQEIAHFLSIQKITMPLYSPLERKSNIKSAFYELESNLGKRVAVVFFTRIGMVDLFAQLKRHEIHASVSLIGKIQSLFAKNR
jgi:hypothetical protein